MSTTYPQFPYSNFPEQIDNFPDAQDVSAELLPLVKQYKALFNSGEYAACQKLLADHPQLKAAQSSALSANQVYDAIGALQTLFKTDIEQYLDGRVPQRIVLSETEPSGLAENDVWLQVVGSGAAATTVNFNIRNAEASFDTIHFDLTPEEIGAMKQQTYDPENTGKVLYAVKADVLGDKGAESFATAAQGKTADELVSGVIPAAKAAQLATVRKIGSADFDGSADVTLAQMGAEPTFAKNDAFNKAFGTAAGTVCQGNDSRLSNARRASNISMSLSGTTLTISYS